MNRKILATVLLITLLPLTAHAQKMVIPAERLFVQERTWWQRLMGKEFKTAAITCQVKNTNPIPQAVTAHAVGITLDDLGEAQPTGEVFSVTPAETILYPDRMIRFVVRVPPRRQGGALVNFYVMATGDAPQMGQVSLRAGVGYFLAVVFSDGKFKPEKPKFGVMRQRDLLTGLVQNPGDQINRITLQIVHDKEIKEHGSFFVEGHSERRFTIADPDYRIDGVVFDYVGSDKRTGIRLPR